MQLVAILGSEESGKSRGKWLSTMNVYRQRI